MPKRKNPDTYVEVTITGLDGKKIRTLRKQAGGRYACVCKVRLQVLGCAHIVDRFTDPPLRCHEGFCEMHLPEGFEVGMEWLCGTHARSTQKSF